VNTTITIKPHGKSERLRYVIAMSICGTLASLACLVAIVTLVSTMPDTTAQAGLTANCDTMRTEIFISSAPSATSFDPATCPITDPSYAKESVLKQ